MRHHAVPIRRTASAASSRSVGAAAFTAFAVAVVAAVISPAAQAVELPAVPALRQQMAQAPATVTVLEPHLTRNGRMPEVRYQGFEATAVLDRVLGPGWSAAGQELEVRALDGFISRIPVERFRQHRAWLVFARQDGSPFEVDNHLQGEARVPLGPYYLVWDNTRSKALQAEGGAVWPYQIAQISVGPSSTKALLPGGMARHFSQAAELARTHCLSCHRIRGYGGDKMPLDLDVVVRGYDAAAWRRWLLDPAAVKPGTTMPPLALEASPAERTAIADQLYAYLRAINAQRKP